MVRIWLTRPVSWQADALEAIVRSNPVACSLLEGLPELGMTGSPVSSPRRSAKTDLPAPPRPSTITRCTATSAFYNALKYRATGSRV